MSFDAEPPEITPPPVLPVETAIAADQVAAHAASGSGHHGPFHTHCENCDTKLEGPFCHKCGQHDFEFHRSFWHVFLEGLESFLHFDSKLFHTVATLIFRPGRLTQEFNAGKRMSQMPPLRLYIFVSLVFFFLLFLDTHAPEELAGHGRIPSAKDIPEETKEDLRQVWKQTGQELADRPPGKRTVDIIREAAEKTKARQLAKADAQAREAAAPEEKAETSSVPKVPAVPKPRKDSEFSRWLRQQGERTLDPAHRKEMIENFIHATPKMLLFCLPLFALYTRLLFRKAGLVYLQHLVLALHFHTLILLWAMLKDGWVFLGGFASASLASWLGAIFWVWLLVYPFLMLRRLFANSWPKTIIKTGLLTGLYGVTLCFAAAVAGFIVFALV
jgi:hypothetical protein